MKGLFLLKRRRTLWSEKCCYSNQHYPPRTVSRKRLKKDNSSNKVTEPKKVCKTMERLMLYTDTDNYIPLMLNRSVSRIFFLLLRTISSLLIYLFY